MPIKRYIINLDLEANKRWNKVVYDHRSKCINVIKHMESLIGSSFMSSVIKGALKGLVKIYDKIGYVMHKDELQSVADLLGVSFESVVLSQLCYEMFSACTSIVFEQDGQNVHYRTMDWNLDILKDITIELDFQRDGKTLFIATSWAGYIGIFTGMKPKCYSIALNYRRSNGTILGNIKRAMSMYWPVGHLIRNLLESTSDYNIVLEKLVSSKLISPCYITICPPIEQPTLIVRDAEKCIDVISESCIIQTNVDPHKDSNYDILYSKKRQALAKKILKDSDKWKTDKEILHAFNQYPIINEDTIYTNIMRSKSDTYLTIINE